MSAPALSEYSTVIVAFSGGKDSLACVLHLLELGVPQDRIELWHHDVDGREGSRLMDWPCTRDYCRQVAKELGIKICFSWKQGGFEREMLKENSRTAPVVFEGFDTFGTPLTKTVGGTRGELGTRLKFPQVSPDLRVRWCSAYLKIDVCAAAIRNQGRFVAKKTLVVSGERAEESASRAKYKVFEPDRADRRAGGLARHVDRWRPVHGWKEREVWDIIERHCIAPHPAYLLGWGRVSCAACIFGTPSQWASLRKVNPRQFDEVAAYENRFGVTIQRTKNVGQLADAGTPYASITPEAVAAALSETFTTPVRLSPGTWKLPAGAFGESCGPT